MNHICNHEDREFRFLGYGEEHKKSTESAYLLKALPTKNSAFTIGKLIHKALCEEEFATVIHSI